MASQRSLLTALLLSATAWSVAQPVLADGDPLRGRKLYQRDCIGCHGDKTTAPSIGPSLVGVIGRRAGTVSGTPYGKAMYESGIVWDDASLQRYLASPGDTVHGTIMPVGVQDPSERDDMIAYLKTLR